VHSLVKIKETLINPFYFGVVLILDITFFIFVRRYGTIEVWHRACHFPFDVCETANDFVCKEVSSLFKSAQLYIFQNT